MDLVFIILFSSHPQNQEEQAYFAVFDGHGGVDAAIYASIHLHVNLVRQEVFPQDPTEALCRAFRITDEGFIKKAAREVSVLNYYSLALFCWFAVKSPQLTVKGNGMELNYIFLHAEYGCM